MLLKFPSYILYFRAMLQNFASYTQVMIHKPLAIIIATPQIQHFLFLSYYLSDTSQVLVIFLILLQHKISIA